MIAYNKNSPNSVISPKETAMLISIYLGINVANDIAQILSETKQGVSLKKDKMINLGLIENAPNLKLSQTGQVIVAKLVAQLNYEVIVMRLSHCQEIA